MPVRLNPYLNFRDNAKEAMEFYQSVLGGELALDTFGSYSVSEDPAEAEKIMHASLNTPSGLQLMAADTPNAMPFTAGSNFAISLSGGPEEASELTGYWEKLAAGGNVIEPLTEAPWGDSFGMVTDRFGILWMVNIGGAPQP